MRGSVGCLCIRERRRTILIRWAAEHIQPVTADMNALIFYQRMAGVLGYFQPQLQPKERRVTNPSSIHLQRIEPGFKGSSLSDVLVIFVARNPDQGGQYIVGWYPHATVHRFEQESTAKAREGIGYYVENDSSTAFLVPIQQRTFPIHRGKGGFGKANICYRYENIGTLKDAPWMDEAVEYVLSYNKENAATNPERASDEEIAELLDATIDRRAGFQSNSRIRKAIEEYAMEWARSVGRR